LNVDHVGELRFVDCCGVHLKFCSIFCGRVDDDQVGEFVPLSRTATASSAIEKLRALIQKREDTGLP
jgi:hypothetical protein